LKVKFVDLSAQHKPLETEIKEVFNRVLANCSFVLGPEVEKFEKMFATYCGAEHCIAVTNGTAALQLVLQGLGVGPGDEVITVAHTFIATAEAINATGARPVFVDIDPVSYTMDPAKLEATITPRTKAIIPVHLYGQPADMDAINAIAGKHNIPVIEDSCQAHGAKYKGRPTGSLGRAACFSFYPSKNLGACGEGGAITTSDPELAKKVRMLRDHGSVKKYEHDFPAYNLRLEGIQGGVLAVKLPHLNGWNENRRNLAKRYNELFAGTKIVTPKQLPYAEHVYHLYVVVVEDREALRKALSEQGIENGLHYPIPLHLQKAYAYLGYQKGDFPVSEHVASNHVSLPMYAELPIEHVEHVAKTVLEILECQPITTSSGRS
jgi:dTDP-4-amino-4,6-dideoxygalactose transaminase